MKADSRPWVAGARSNSGISLALQKQCHISRLEPYDMPVSSSHAWTMVSFTRSCSSPLSARLVTVVGQLGGGSQSLRRSFARQCGQRSEGVGVRFWGYGASRLSAETVVGRAGHGRGCASMSFRCLASLCSIVPAPKGALALSHACTIHLTATSLTMDPGSDVNEERPDFGWDGDRVEAAAEWGVAASQGGVCWVLCTRNVSRVYSSIVLL